MIKIFTFVLIMLSISNAYFELKMERHPNYKFDLNHRDKVNLDSHQTCPEDFSYSLHNDTLTR